jgi:peptidoglycan/LPS O-acetylase OafA/YrhL
MLPRAARASREPSLADPSGAAAPRRADALLARLSRRTTTGRYLPEIDGLRFVCIALVVLLHVQQMSQIWSGHGRLVAPFGYLHAKPVRGGLLARTIANGTLGVIVFFAISGFVLALPFLEARLAGRRVDLGRYYLRRVTRIEPPYVVAMIAAFALAPIAAAGYGRLVPHLLTGLVYLHGPVYGDVNPLGVHTWSLEVEMQFYVLVPLIAAIVFAPSDRSSRVVRAVIVCLFSSAAFTALFEITGYAAPNVFGEMAFFVVGIVLADHYVRVWHGRPSASRGWDAVSLVAWPALVLFWSDLRVGAPFLVLLVVTAAFRGPVTRRILRNRWISTIGGMCYSIYLTHLPLLVLLAPLGRRLVVGGYGPTMLVETLVLVPIVLVVGTAFFVLIERPCMDPAWPGRGAALVRRAAARRRHPEVVAPS